MRGSLSIACMSHGLKLLSWGWSHDVYHCAAAGVWQQPRRDSKLPAVHEQGEHNGSAYHDPAPAAGLLFWRGRAHSLSSVHIPCQSCVKALCAWFHRKVCSVPTGSVYIVQQNSTVPWKVAASSADSCASSTAVNVSLALRHYCLHAGI